MDDKSVDHYLKYYSQLRNPHVLEFPERGINQSIKDWMLIIRQMEAKGLLYKSGDTYYLTGKGYEVLEAGGYKKYLFKEKVGGWRDNLNTAGIIFGVLIGIGTLYYTYLDSKGANEPAKQNSTQQLESTSKSAPLEHLKDSLPKAKSDTIKK